MINTYNFDVTVQEICIFFTHLTQIRLDIRGTVKKYTGALLNTSVRTELHANMMKCDSFLHLFKFLLLNNNRNELHQFGSDCDIHGKEVAEIYIKSDNMAVDKVIVQSVTCIK
jgi:hypothetical protein